MPRIYVQFSGLDQIGTGCKTVASKVDTIESEFQSTVRALDWEIRAAQDIEKTATQISRKLDQQIKALNAYQKFINEAYQEYVKLDEYGKNKTDTPEVGTVSDKSYVIPAILGMFSPLAGLLAITSGIWKGDTPSFFDDTRFPSTSTETDWLGYELSDEHPGVKAWLGKASASAENEWGYAGVNAYLGKVEAGVTSDFSFMESTKKKAYKDGKWSGKPSTEFINAELGLGVDVSVLGVDGEAGIGSDMLGAEVSGEGSLGNAELSAKSQFHISDKGVSVVAGGKAMVSAAEGQAKGTINILGLEITAKASGYAGALGVEGKVGIEDNKLVLEGGAAALLGGSVGIEVGFNEEGWDNFVDFVVFWD